MPTTIYSKDEVDQLLLSYADAGAVDEMFADIHDKLVEYEGRLAKLEKPAPTPTPTPDVDSFGFPLPYAVTEATYASEFHKGKNLDLSKVRVSGTNSTTKMTLNSGGWLDVQGPFRFTALNEARPTAIWSVMEFADCTFDTTNSGAGWRMEHINSDFETSAVKQMLYGCDSGACCGAGMRGKEKRLLNMFEGLNHFAYLTIKELKMLVNGYLPTNERVIWGYASYNLDDGSRVQEQYILDEAQKKWKLLLTSVNQKKRTITAPNGAVMDEGDNIMSYGATASDGKPCAWFEAHRGIIPNKGAIGQTR